MFPDSFVSELKAFLKQVSPAPDWHAVKNGIIVITPVTKKKMLFSKQEPPANSSNSKYDYLFTQTMWDNNKEAVKSRICSLIGDTKKIHGRICTIQKITKNQARDFVNQNHLMGYANAHFNFGLFVKHDLVAVACFSKGRKMDRLPANKKSFELIRFCNKNYHTVVGGLSKLIRYFEKEVAPGDIMTYIDQNWGQPHTYYALGFVLEENIGEPNEKFSNLKLIKRLL